MKAVLILSILLCVELVGVFGKPNSNSLQDFELMCSERPKRQVGEVITAGIDAAFKYGGQAIDNISKCADKAGCHKGYCWTWCGLSLSGGDWCYTSKSYSQSFQYVACTEDSECDPCWKCAGSCTL